MSVIKDILGLFYPPTCPACGETLGTSSLYVCTRCRWDMPLTGFTSQFDNPVAQKFWGLLPVINACSFIYYIPDSNFVNLIHNFKYRGNWRIANDMGLWFGAELREGELYSDVDFIVPVPLHYRKKMSRGYNQAEYLAAGIGQSLAIPVNDTCIARRKHNESQTHKKDIERWDNVEGIFYVRDAKMLAGKHILLVDDVLTTGATLVSMGEAILAVVPDCRISIATLAVSKAKLKMY